MIDFRDPVLADKDWVERCFRASGNQGCEYCFATLFLWSGTYRQQVASLGGYVLERMCGSRGPGYLFPAGSGPLEEALAALEADAAERGEPCRFFCVTPEQGQLLEAIRQTEAKLIILDPLSAYIGETTSINSANEVRRQFRPLIDIAKEQGCAIVIVHHMNKAIGQKALNRSVGSVDIVGAARSVLLVGRTDKDRPDERILAQVKSNLAPTGNAILFSVDESGVKWIEETARTADEVLGNVFAQAGRPDGQMQKAKEMLSALLADGTPKPQSEVMEKLTAAGVGKSTATKAKALLGIRSVKQGMQWFWVLPDSEE